MSIICPPPARESGRYAYESPAVQSEPVSEASNTTTNTILYVLAAQTQESFRIKTLLSCFCPTPMCTVGLLHAHVLRFSFVTRGKNITLYTIQSIKLMSSRSHDRISKH